MTPDVSVLLDREKDVLRLLLVGHDAKASRAISTFQPML